MMKQSIRYGIIWGLCCLVGLSKIYAQKLKVLATTTFIADLAQNIAGDYLEVRSIMPIGGDPHIYEPVPGDAKKIVDADLILRNGLHLEGWLDEMIENSGTKAPIVTISEGVKAINSIGYNNAFDPHAWMDPHNASIYIAHIKNALQLIDPAHATAYQANFESYKQELDKLDRDIREAIQKIPAKQRVLATTHDAFRYFGNRYGLKVVSILGTSTDAQVRMDDINHLIQIIRTYSIPAIFIESTINPKLLIQVAEDLHIAIGGKLFADSLGDEESGADTYLKMLRQNTALIVQGLTRPLAHHAEQADWTFLWVILTLFALAFGLLSYRLRSRSEAHLNWDKYAMEIKGLSVSYDRKTALTNIYLNIEPGYVYGLVGGNGSGKSTLFKSILGLINTDAGSIRINNREVKDILKHISYIPQKEEIDWGFPASVLDVVLLGRYPHRGVFERLTKKDRKKALDAIEQMGISELKDKQIGELSGGQQQRVFIARALCQEAEIYLMDEPFVGVDITTENRIMEIVRLLAEKGKMVVIIHHDLAKVKDYFDRIIMLNQHLVAIGDTEEVFTDQNIKKTYGGRLTILQRTETYL